MPPVPVHLDTDIGGDIDDLCALAMLVRWPDVELTGVTTVLEAGGKRAGYVHQALEVAGHADVPVAAGADIDLGRFREQPYGLLPDERYWGVPVAPAPGALVAALDLLADSIERDAVVVAVGPVTNLALLEQRDPGTLRRATLCIMGGFVRPLPPGYPAWDHRMDFNLQSDIEAARLVLESCDPARTTLVPIEVTVQTWLRPGHLDALRAGGALARLVARQAEACAEDERRAERLGRPHSGLPDDLINFQHDQLACAVALGWEGVTREELRVAVDLDGGWVRLREATGGRPLRVVTGVDGRAFEQRWLEVLTSA